MIAMSRTSILMVAAFVVLLGAPTAGWANGTDEALAPLEQLLAESADTPAEHRALAHYYSARAEEARQQAAHHRTMAKTYRGKLGEKNRMKRHCARLVELNDEIAVEYDGLAAGQRQASER